MKKVSEEERAWERKGVRRKGSDEEKEYESKEVSKKWGEKVESEEIVFFLNKSKIYHERNV